MTTRPGPKGSRLDSGILRIVRDEAGASHGRSTTVDGVTCWVIAAETVCEQVLQAFARRPGPHVPSLPRGAPLAVLVAGEDRAAWNSYGGHGLYVINPGRAAFEERGHARLHPGDAFLMVNNHLAELLSLVEVHCELCKSRTAEAWMQLLTLRLLDKVLDRDSYVAAGVIVT